MSGVKLVGLTVAESDLLQHVGMFGSASYPIRKLAGGKWVISDFWGVKAPPTTYKTRRAAVAQFEAVMDMIRAKHAGRMPRSPGADIVPGGCEDDAAGRTAPGTSLRDRLLPFFGDRS